MLLIIGIILGVACISYLIYLEYKFCKNHLLGNKEICKIDGNLKKILLALVIGQGFFTILSSYGLVIANSWNINAGEHVMLIFGSYFMGSGFSCLVSSFIIYFYRPDLEAKQRKISKICMYSAIPVFILGVILLTQSIAYCLTYPLANSISFKTGFGFPDYKDYGFTIAFYGIIIVFGALVSYFISDHYMFKKYGKHGLLDTLLLVAFPMGLVGARLWYCLVLEPQTYLPNPGAIFNVRDGGLAIMGGALLGIVSGVLFILRFRKYINIRFAMDIIIPTILIAQGIGRFGNFFNQEVYGGIIPREAISWLPSIITNNMYINGEYRLPLFLIESCINIGGYFVIRYAVGKGLKKYLSLGDLAFSYVIWYGATRACLEPLRDGFSLDVTTKTGFGYIQSWITAFAMIAVGILGIVGCHVYDYIRKKKGLAPRTLDTI